MLFVGSKWHDARLARTNRARCRCAKRVQPRFFHRPSERASKQASERATDRRHLAQMHTPAEGGASPEGPLRCSLLSFLYLFLLLVLLSRPPLLTISLSRSVYFPVADAASPRSIFLLAASDAGTACGSSAFLAVALPLLRVHRAGAYLRFPRDLMTSFRADSTSVD